MRITVKFDDGDVMEFEATEVSVSTLTPPTIEAEAYSVVIKEALGC